MVDQSPELCGICKRLGLGREMIPIRLAAGERTERDGTVVEPGLYNACPECVADHRAYLAAAMGKKPEEVSKQMMQ